MDTSMLPEAARATWRAWSESPDGVRAIKIESRHAAKHGGVLVPFAFLRDGKWMCVIHIR